MSHLVSLIYTALILNHFNSSTRNLIFRLTATGCLPARTVAVLTPPSTSTRLQTFQHPTHKKRLQAVKTTRVQTWLFNLVKILHFHCKFNKSAEGSQHHCNTNLFEVQLATDKARMETKRETFKEYQSC